MVIKHFNHLVVKVAHKTYVTTKNSKDYFCYHLVDQKKRNYYLVTDSSTSFDKIAKVGKRYVFESCKCADHELSCVVRPQEVQKTSIIRTE